MWLTQGDQLTIRRLRMVGHVTEHSGSWFQLERSVYDCESCTRTCSITQYGFLLPV